MSLTHYLIIGFFDLHTEHFSPGEEPTPLRPLDRAWVERDLHGLGPEASAAFWFTDSGCLWSTLSWEATARAIVDHHGQGCVVIHLNQGLVAYPPAAVIERSRIHGWSPPTPGDAQVDPLLFTISTPDGNSGTTGRSRDLRAGVPSRFQYRSRRKTAKRTWIIALAVGCLLLLAFVAAGLPLLFSWYDAGRFEGKWEVLEFNADNGQNMLPPFRRDYWKITGNKLNWGNTDTGDDFKQLWVVKFEWGTQPVLHLQAVDGTIQFKWHYQFKGDMLYLTHGSSSAVTLRRWR